MEGKDLSASPGHDKKKKTVDEGVDASLVVLYTAALPHKAINVSKFRFSKIKK